MFSALSLEVPLGGAGSRAVGEEALQQPVGSKDAKGIRAPRLGQGEPLGGRRQKAKGFGAFEDPESLAAGDFEHAGQSLEGTGDAAGFTIVEVLERVFDAYPFADELEPTETGNDPDSGPEQGREDEEDSGEDQEWHCRLTASKY